MDGYSDPDADAIGASVSRLFPNCLTCEMQHKLNDSDQGQNEKQAAQQAHPDEVGKLSVPEIALAVGVALHADEGG